MLKVKFHSLGREICESAFGFEGHYHSMAKFSVPPNFIEDKKNPCVEF